MVFAAFNGSMEKHGSVSVAIADNTAFAVAVANSEMGAMFQNRQSVGSFIIGDEQPLRRAFDTFQVGIVCGRRPSHMEVHAVVFLK